jgi:hypothetical protein
MFLGLSRFWNQFSVVDQHALSFPLVHVLGVLILCFGISLVGRICAAPLPFSLAHVLGF